MKLIFKNDNHLGISISSKDKRKPELDHVDDMNRAWLGFIRTVFRAYFDREKWLWFGFKNTLPYDANGYIALIVFNIGIFYSKDYFGLNAEYYNEDGTSKEEE